MPGSTPHAKTVARKAGQGAEPGRPAVVPYHHLTMAQNAAKAEGYQFLWQKVKPPVIERVDKLLQPFTRLPEGLKPTSLRAIEARQHRRDH